MKLTIPLLFIELMLNSYSESVATQQKTITGKVTDSNGQQLSGVTGVVKGTTMGTITGADGNYSLSNISSDTTLAFSSVGMKKQRDPRPEPRGLTTFVDWFSVWPGNVGYDAHGEGHLTDAPQGVRLAVQEAETYGPILQADRPWETFLTAGCNVLPTESGFKMWYTVFAVARDKKTGQAKKTDFLNQKLGEFQGVEGQYFRCYAESDDGFTWRKPELGLFEFAGLTANNILAELKTGGKYGSPNNVFLDRDGGYRMLISDGDPIPGSIIPGMYSLTSPDGIHWTPDGPVLDMSCDGDNTGFYDELLGKYVLYMRYARGYRRAVGMTEGPEFSINKLPHPRIVLEPDSQDPPSLDFYTIAYSRHPEYRKVNYQSFTDPRDNRGRLDMFIHHDARDMHFSFMSVYHRDRDVVDIQLAISRDGWQWSRPERKAIIPLDPGSGVTGQIYAFPGIHVLKPGLWGVLYQNINVTHNFGYSFPEAANTIFEKSTLRWATWKENRLVALQADAEGMCTVTLAGRDNHLGPAFREIRFNYATEPGGWIRVELISKEGLWPPTGPVPIAGYTFADCDVLRGDSLSQSVTWNGNSALPQTTLDGGSHTILRLHMMKAKLFAIEWE